MIFLSRMKRNDSSRGKRKDVKKGFEGLPF
jgi:hypothetical protein